MAQYTTSQTETRVLFALRVIAIITALAAIVVTIVLSIVKQPSLGNNNDPSLLVALASSVWAVILDFFEILGLWPTGAKLRRLPPPMLFLNEVLICPIGLGSVVMFEGLYYMNRDGKGQWPPNSLVDSVVGITVVYVAMHLVMMFWSVVRLKLWWIERKKQPVDAQGEKSERKTNS